MKRTASAVSPLTRRNTSKREKLVKSQIRSAAGLERPSNKRKKKQTVKKKEREQEKQESDGDANSEQAEGAPLLKKKKKSRAQFVVKLFELLQSGQHSDIISWHENSFVIWNRQQFANKVLPTLFNHSNFSSFERQMNFYHFSKMAADADLPSKKRMKKTEPTKFRHRLFVKDASLANIQLISRTTAPNETEQVRETLRVTNERVHTMRQKIQALQIEISTLRAHMATLPPIVSLTPIFSPVHAPSFVPATVQGPRTAETQCSTSAGEGQKKQQSSKGISKKTQLPTQLLLQSSVSQNSLVEHLDVFEFEPPSTKICEMHFEIEYQGEHALPEDQYHSAFEFQQFQQDTSTSTVLEGLAVPPRSHLHRLLEV